MKQKLFSKTLSPLVLACLLASLVSSGILLPRQNALALDGDYIGGPANVAGWIAERIADAYESSGTWISALKDQWEWADTLLEQAMTAAWQQLKKQLLNMMVDDIVNWINGGGEPKFVSDWGGFLSDAVDQAGGQFLDELGLGFLCNNLAPTIRIALSSNRTFAQKAKCTLSDMGENLDNFFEDFTDGGWATWMQLSQPQNNIFGAYYMALDAKWLAELSASEEAKNEALSGGGFLSDKVCKELFCPGQGAENSSPYMGGTWTKDEISADANLSNNCSCTKWETRTPGKMIGDTLSKAVGTDIDWLVGADEWGEYLGAIADAAINRIFREGLTSLKGEGSSGQTGAGITYPVSGSTLNASPYEDAVKNKTLGVKLNEQLLLLKENQEKLVSDYQTSLSVLNDTKTAQIDGLTAIKDILAKQACSLPSSVSLSVLSSQSLISCPPLVSTCGCTKDTLKVTAANVGEATIERTLSLCGDYLGGSSSIINSSPAASATVSQLENQISTRQTQVAKIALAIVNLSDYLKKIDEYNIAYENWKNGSGTQNAATLAETAMWTAKTKALSSLQDFFNTTVSDLQQLLTKAQQLSQQTIQEYGDSQIKRGVSGYCGYNTGDTYYQSLCKAQSAKSSLQTALSSCLAL